MKRAIGYVRVSTTQQSEEGVSLKAQEERIRSWCSFQGYELAGIFTDAGLSGKTTNRKGLQTALKECRKDDALVVYSLSRLSRSLHDLLDLTEYLGKRKADLVSLTEKIDTTSPYGKAFFQISGVFHELERNLIAERTKTALAYKRSQGMKTGGKHTEYGKDLNESGHLINNELEQRVIANIRSLRDKGYTMQEICSFLQDNGVPTKSGLPNWNCKTISTILKRTA